MNIFESVKYAACRKECIGAKMFAFSLLHFGKNGFDYSLWNSFWTAASLWPRNIFALALFILINEILVVVEMTLMVSRGK